MNNITHKHLYFKSAIITIFAFIGVFLIHTPVKADDTATRLPIDITLSTSGRASNITDGSYYTELNFKSGDSITISSASDIYGLYIIWNKDVSEWNLEYNGSIIKCGTNGFLHEYVPIQNGTGSCTINILNDASICSIYAYSAGSLPSDVQQWKAPCNDNTDILVLSTHADDEILFLGGVLATYGGNENLNVQVAYMCDFFITESYREHEKLDGLWEAGITHYPVKGSFKDIGSRSLTLAMSQYSYDDVLSYVTSCFRRFKPLVCVTQDLDGEYGHGGHMLYAKTVSEALDISNDASKYPESAAQYGTWDVSKAYFHLYKENPIKLDLQTPLANMGNRTAIQVAQDAYDKHVSQHKWDFAITDKGFVTTGNASYSCSDFGLYKTLVGADTGNDMLENITTYEEQERLVKEAEEASIKAEEASIEAESQKTAHSDRHIKITKTKIITIIILIIIFILAAFLSYKYYVLVQSRKKRNARKKKASEKKESR